MWRATATARRRWELSDRPTSWGGMAVSHRSHLQAHSFYLAALSGHRQRESQRRWRESRRRSVVGSEHSTLASWSLAGYCTMAKPIQGAWQLKFRANSLSIFYGILPKDLHQSCRATNQLHFGYRDWTQLSTRSRLNPSPKMAMLHCKSEVQSSMSLIARL
jgi:hypothetical protein